MVRHHTMLFYRRDAGAMKAQDDNPLTLYKTAGYAAVVQGVQTR